MAALVVESLFAAGTCGTTLTRDLFRSLAISRFESAMARLDRIALHPLIRTGLEPASIPTVIGDFAEWMGGADPRLEYQHVQLVLRALSVLGRVPDDATSAWAMIRALAAGDVPFAEHTARRLLDGGRGSPWKIVVQSHDVLGRVHTDRGELADSARNFAAGATAARAAGMDDEEWDERTKLAWCLYARHRYAEALQEIDIAERIARRTGRAGALLKSLIDRGHAEQALGRRSAAQAAFISALREAEK